MWQNVHLFLRLYKIITLYVCTIFSFIHSDTVEHLDCFYLLTTVNKTAMIMGIYLGDPACNYFTYKPRNEISGTYGNSTFKFLNSFHTGFHNCCLAAYKGSNFSTSLTTFIFCSFNIFHPDRCEVISHCGVISSLISDIEHLFIVYLFWRTV